MLKPTAYKHISFLQAKYKFESRKLLQDYAENVELPFKNNPLCFLEVSKK